MDMDDVFNEYKSPEGVKFLLSVKKTLSLCGGVMTRSSIPHTSLSKFPTQFMGVLMEPPSRPSLSLLPSGPGKCLPTPKKDHRYTLNSFVLITTVQVADE